MSVILVVFFAACVGAIHHEFIQYWLSQLMTTFRRKSPLIGQWKLTYRDNNDEQVTETIRVFAEFADVAYGDLQAQLLDGSTATYRVRFEHIFDNQYSLILKPADRSIADIGVGILSVNFEDRTALARTMGLSRERASTGQQVYIREANATKV